MSQKDRYGVNLRRGDRVKDLRPDSNKEGEFIGSGIAGFALVQWDDEVEEKVRAVDLQSKAKRFSR